MNEAVFEYIRSSIMLLAQIDKAQCVEEAEEETIKVLISRFANQYHEIYLAIMNFVIKIEIFIPEKKERALLISKLSLLQSMIETEFENGGRILAEVVAGMKNIG